MEKNGQRSSVSNPSTATIILFSFLFSIDSISNPPVDALFWSQIDYCWFFPIFRVYLETDEEILDKKLDK